MRATIRIPASGTRVIAVPRDELVRLLDRVGEESRSLLLLHEFEGHNYAEIAVMTGLSASVVKAKVSRAKKRFDGLLARFKPSPEVIALTEQAQRLIATMPLQPAELLKMTPREFEELIAALWKRFGYEVELTARTRDGGRDVIAVRKAEATLRFLIECKRYEPEKKIGVAFVRALYGVKVHENATKAILATTSTFTAGAESFFDAHKWELEAKDHSGVLNWIDEARRFARDGETGLWVPENDVPAVRGAKKGSR
jgi:HJR/Mrr/RecB family endonuclease